MGWRMGKKGRLLSFTMGVLLCILFVVSSGKQIHAEGRTVRVGYYPTADYQEVDEYGNYAGFSYDYFMQIQKYTRWNYEFVQASYAECVQMLLEGKLDIISGMGKTPEREEQMIFSKYSNSNSQNKIYAKKSRKDFFYESFDTFDGSKIGMIKGVLTDEVLQYAEDHGFQTEIIFFDNMMDMNQALQEDKIDMVCASSISNDMNTKIVARMDKKPLYYVVNKDRQDIADELNSALSKIISNNPDFYTQMSEKYTLSGANATATFTREEMEYIESDNKVYVIANPDWAPITWRDPKTGEFKGIFVDVINRIEAYSGLTFVICTEAEFNQWVVDAPNMVNDVVAILADDNSWAVKQSVMMSNHVVDSSVVMVTKRAAHQGMDNENITIALPDRFYIGYVMRDELKGKTVVNYPTVEDCLHAVNSGKADATYVNELVATYYLSMLKYSELYATANSGYYENLAFAVNKDSPAPLLSILDKSLLCLGKTDMEQIVIQNSIAEERNSLKGLLYANPGLVAGVMLTVSLIVVGIVLYIYVTISKKKRTELELQREFEINSARTEFFMMISHELRTPLNAIIGYLGLAEEQYRKNGAEMEYIRRSRNASKQLSAIADDMLDYTKISTGTLELHHELFDMKNVVMNVDQNMFLKAAEKNLQYHFRIGSFNHEYVIGDQLRVTQVIQNIIANAIKFTASGGSVEVMVSEELLEDDKVIICFTCADTGKGMSEEFLEKVCAPFNQSDQSYSRTHGGLGLGLYLTKYFINQMQGTFMVESKLGVGSTVTVKMPLKRLSSEEMLNKEIDCSHVRTIIGGTNQEDNQRLKELLKRLHIKCDCMTEPEKLLKRIQSRMGGEYEYSLCVLDESFLEEQHIVEQLKTMEHAPVIFVMTSNLTLIDSMMAERKVDQVLYKPIFQSVLFDAVMNTFGEYKVEDCEPKEIFDGMHAMIVEDNTVNADILTKILSKVKIEVVVCENGQIAVDTFEREPEGTFQVILMDIQMPVMNGYEATKNIRRSEKEQGAKIPIIAVSANAFPEDIQQSLASGMNEHIAKPVMARKLYQLISQYCLRQVSTGEA